MPDLSVQYMGLTLKNPLIVASSGLTTSVQNIKDYAAKGASAIILKSLFEEQIIAESDRNIKRDESYGYDVQDYITRYTRDNVLGNYLKLIKEAKAAVDIPIIASINCVSDEEWISFTSKIEEAGADGIEINISLLPSDPEASPEKTEQTYFSILEKVKKTTNLPLGVKMSYYSSNLAALIRKISWSRLVDSIVLFNRYYSPDIDTKELKMTSTSLFSTPQEIGTSLRWIALSRKHVDISLSATTGIHDGNGMVKQILAGADTVQIASVLYQQGAEVIATMLKDLEAWMDEKGYKSLNDFKGIMSFDKKKNTAAFERIQFMKHFGGIE